ncbi:Uncharacterised protein [uncultured archaeon]|nr:Uncharacterised protein [uncultured archaeon]
MTKALSDAIMLSIAGQKPKRGPIQGDDAKNRARLFFKRHFGSRASRIDAFRESISLAKGRENAVRAVFRNSARLARLLEKEAEGKMVPENRRNLYSEASNAWMQANVFSAIACRGQPNLYNARSMRSAALAHGAMNNFGPAAANMELAYGYFIKADAWHQACDALLAAAEYRHKAGD